MKRSILFAIISLFLGVLLGITAYLYHYFYPQQYEKLSNGNYINITTKQSYPFPVTENTFFEIEYYYADEQRTLIEHPKDISVFIGFNKIELEKYLKEYMKDLPINEKQNGLISYDLISYNGNTIYLKKTYKKTENDGFYAKSFNGLVVIMKSDEKTVFEYTQIPINILPKEIQNQMQVGYYLEDENTLYNFLETYSS